MKKLSHVVMLPTEKASSDISKGNITGVLTYHQFFRGTEGIYTNHTYQHLYFLSDDKIEEGDWVLNSYGGINSIYQFRKCDFDSIHFKGGYCQKIIASTNKSLRLPRPSNEFLNKYCEAGDIDEVMVEYYEDYYLHYYTPAGWIECCEKINLGYKLKVAPDNTISIYPIK